ncbi:MAG: sodium:calcium antiporter [Phycisphaerae bacterium]
MLSRLYFQADLPTWALFLEILVSGWFVVFLASRLTVLADKLGDELNLGKAWIGMLLLATVTSLPEVVTGATAVGIGNPNLAFATIFGSCSFNIILIVMINFVMGEGSVLGRAGGSSHVLTSSFGIILICLSLLGITLVQEFMDRQQPGAAAWCEWVVCALIVGCYLMFVRLTYRFEHNGKERAGNDKKARQGTAGLGWSIALIAVLLVAAAWWLTQTGDVLAVHPIEALGRPLGASFVGAAFLALATSLPEVVTCLAALKLGHLDLALGNIFGSNMFNILVIPLLKIVSAGTGQALLMAGDQFDALQNTITGLLPLLLTGITVAALTYRTKRRILRFGFDSIMLAAVYGFGMYLLFSHQGSTP